jgi:DNA-binding GntR family transcriptional regulator
VPAHWTAEVRSIRRQVVDDPDQDPRSYLHVYSVLAGRIKGGEYPAGAKLPTETELTEEFGCGPGTAAQVLRALQRDGLARRVLRKGYFSSGPDDYSGQRA